MREPTESELDAAWIAEQVAAAGPLSADDRRQLVDLFELIEHDESGAA